MQLHYLGRQIQRCQRNILWVCGVLLCALGLPFVVKWRYFANYLRGPVPLTATELQSIQHAESLPHYFVTLQGGVASETGLAEVEERRNPSSNELDERTPHSEILLVPLGDQRLAVKAPLGQRGSDWHGGLHTLDRELKQQLSRALATTGPGAPPRLLPVYLDATGFRRPGHIALSILLPAMAIVLWAMARAARRYRNILTHPILTKIERYGPPQTVLQQIDQEAEAAGGHMETGLTLVTASYLIFGGEYRVEIVRFVDIVWAHAQVLEHRKLGVTVGREHWLCVYEKSGQKVDLPAPGRTPRGLLKIIHERAPDAIIGHSDEVAALWARDRDHLVAQVESAARRGSKTPANKPTE